MSKLFDRSTIYFLGKAIIIALLIVFTVRIFVAETFVISTNHMQSSLQEGDEVLVSKLSYGPRLPITLLSLPFSDNRYYSEWIKLPYKRLFSSSLKKNDVVVFNSPLEQEKPLDKRNLLVSRCVALPGDTILIANGVYYFNSNEYVQAPTKLDRYSSSTTEFHRLSRIAKEIGISLIDEALGRDTVSFSLSKYDAFILRQNIDKNVFKKQDQVVSEHLAFIVPSQGREVLLSGNNVNIYRDIITMEMGQRVSFKDDNVYVDGKKIEVYTFQDDYYWMLSDNTIDGVDSRVLGFIPYKNVIGRATTVLYSSDDEGFKTDRFFKTIN